jgi:hypothetical protein
LKNTSPGFVGVGKVVPLGVDPCVDKGSQAVPLETYKMFSSVLKKKLPVGLTGVGSVTPLGMVVDPVIDSAVLACKAYGTLTN